MMPEEDLSPFIELLESGEVVAFPTETVYGLGADAQNPGAVQKIFDLKERPADNPLIIHISKPGMAELFAQPVTEDAKKLMDAFWPGPLTLILRKKVSTLDLVTGGLDTVALRMPDNETALKLIDAVGPLAAPSANKSGRPSPTSPSHVKTDFGENFPIAGNIPTRIGIESTVVDLSESPYQILRPGAITFSQVEEILDKKILPPDIQKQEDRSTRSPGTKYTHYSPNAKVEWLPANAEQFDKDTFYLLHTGKHTIKQSVDQRPLSSLLIEYNGDYKQMGRELYDRFRQADTEDLPVIAIEKFSNKLLEEKPFTVALKNRIDKAIGRS